MPFRPIPALCLSAGAVGCSTGTAAAATTLTRNLLLRNGDLGIEAVPGVIDAAETTRTATATLGSARTSHVSSRAERLRSLVKDLGRPTH